MSPSKKCQSGKKFWLLIFVCRSYYYFCVFQKGLSNFLCESMTHLISLFWLVEISLQRTKTVIWKWDYAQKALLCIKNILCVSKRLVYFLLFDSMTHLILLFWLIEISLQRTKTVIFIENKKDPLSPSYYAETY